MNGYNRLFAAVRVALGALGGFNATGAFNAFSVLTEGPRAYAKGKTVLTAAAALALLPAVTAAASLELKGDETTTYDGQTVTLESITTQTATTEVDVDPELVLKGGARVTVEGNAVLAEGAQLLIDRNLDKSYAGGSAASVLIVKGKLTLSKRVTPSETPLIDASEDHVEGAKLEAGELELNYDGMMHVKGHLASGTSDSSGRRATLTTNKLTISTWSRLKFSAADLDLGDVTITVHDAGLSFDPFSLDAVRLDEKSTVKMSSFTMTVDTADTTNSSNYMNSAVFGFADVDVSGDVTLKGYAGLSVGIGSATAPGWLKDADGNLLTDGKGNYLGARNRFTARAISLEETAKTDRFAGSYAAAFANTDVTVESASVKNGGVLSFTSQDNFYGISLADSEARGTVRGTLSLSSTAADASTLAVLNGATLTVQGATTVTGNGSIAVTGAAAQKWMNAEMEYQDTSLRSAAQFASVELNGETYAQDGTVSDSYCSGSSARLCATRADVTVTGALDLKRRSSVSLTDATLKAGSLSLEYKSQVTADEDSTLTVGSLAMVGNADVAPKLTSEGILKVTENAVIGKETHLGSSSTLAETLSAKTLTVGGALTTYSGTVTVTDQLAAGQVRVAGGAVQSASLKAASGTVIEGITVSGGTLSVTGAAGATGALTLRSTVADGTFTNADEVAAKDVTANVLKNSGNLTVVNMLSLTGETGASEITAGAVTAKVLGGSAADLTVSGGALEVTEVANLKNLTLSAGVVTTGSLKVTEKLTVQEGTAVNAGDVKAGTVVTASTVTATSLEAAAIENTGDLTVEGILILGSGDSALSGGSVKAGSLAALGNVAVTDSSLEVTGGAILADGKTLSVGSSSASGKFTAASLSINGGTVVLDPDWTQTESTGAFALAAADGAAGELDGTVIVGRNSQLMIGAATTDKLTAAFSSLGEESEKRTAHTFGENDVQAVLYAGQRISMTSDDTLAVKGSVTDASAVAGIGKGVTVGANSLLIVDGSLATSTLAVISTEDTNVLFTLEDGSLLYVDHANSSHQGVRVASGFVFSESEIAAVEEAGGFGAVSRIYEYRTHSLEGNALTLFFDTLPDAGDLFCLMPDTGLAVSGGAASGTLAGERVNALIDSTNGLTDDEVRQGFNKIALMGAAGGTQTAAFNASTMVTGAIAAHTLQDRDPDIDRSSAAWVTLSGMTSEADDYRAGCGTCSAVFGWKSDLTGLTAGIDYTKEHLTAGLAASVGMGSVRANGAASGTKNSVTYFGAHVYGVYEGEYLDTSAVAGVTILRSELTQSGYKARPTTAALTASVQWEKGLPLGQYLTVTPHIGVKYTRLTGARFTAGGFAYGASDANLLEVPAGVRLTGNFETADGTRWQPLLDVSYRRNFGGTAVGQRIGAAGLDTFDAFDAQVLGRHTYGVTAGLRATGDAHSMDFAYGIKAGEGGRRDQTLRARYSYRF